MRNDWKDTLPLRCKKTKPLAMKSKNLVFELGERTFCMLLLHSLSQFIKKINNCILEKMFEAFVEKFDCIKKVN